MKTFNSIWEIPANLGLNLAEHHLAGPGGVGPEMLQVLAIGSVQGTRHVGKVTAGVHSQLPPQILIGLLTAIPGAGLEAGPKPRPELTQAIAQLSNRFRWKAPASGVIQDSVSSRCRIIRSLKPQVGSSCNMDKVITNSCGTFV